VSDDDRREIDALVRRLGAWLDAWEVGQADQGRRRRLRSLLIYLVALGTIVALSDLTPGALAFVPGQHPTAGALASQILGTSLAAAGGILIIVEYLEWLAYILAEGLYPLLCAVAVCGGSLAGSDIPGWPVAVGALAIGLLWPYVGVMRDVDDRKPTKRSIQPALRNAFARRPLGGKDRTQYMTDLRKWYNDRFYRIWACAGALFIVASWPSILGTRQFSGRSSAELWFGLSMLPAVAVGTTVLIVRARGKRTRQS
jgi:hypothetical protein